MALTQAMIDVGLNSQIEFYRKNDPIDQVNTDRVWLGKLLADMREDSIFGNGFYNESLYVTNDSNYQNYYGRQQVTYNDKNPDRLAKFGYGNAHDGFMVDEDELRRNGITITDSETESTMDGAEKIQIVNLAKSKYRALKEGYRDGLERELLMAGGDAESVKGLDHLVSTTPSTGTVGNIDTSASANSFWRNNANVGVTRANVVEEMEESMNAAMLYGGQRPNFIMAGLDFINNYDAVAASKIQRHIAVQGRGGTALDPTITGRNFHGIHIVWNPFFERIDAEVGAITYPWTRRAYMLNTNTIKLRPVKGAWMVNRKPPRPFDRYVHFRGLTSSFGLTINARNRNAVVSIAAP